MRDITLADTFYQLFSTRAFATGVPTTLAGTPVVSAYENESLTQITAGITLGVDHDGVAGLHLLTVVASSGNGYEAGKDYALVITTGTVGGVSVVGEVVAEFTIGRSAAAVDLANGTDGLGAIKADTAAILVDTGTTLDARIPAALVGGRMDSSVGAMAANVMTAAAAAADLSAEIADAVWDEDATGHQTGGTFGQAIGDPAADTATIYAAVVTNAAGVDVAADIIAVKADTAAILTDTGTTLDARIPAALVGGRMDASVGAMAAGTVTAAATAADFLAEVNAEVVDALAVDTYAQPGQEAPAATTSLSLMIRYLYKAFRNHMTQDATTFKLMADDAATVDQKATVSDDAVTFVRGEIGTGP